MKNLTKSQIEATSSQYLKEGRKQETWEISSVLIKQSGLVAEIVMTETYVSNTDVGGFHLTTFSSLEFLSQLMIVYAHEWAGLERKVREGWMVDSQIKCAGSIRSTVMEVNMDVHKIKKRGDNLYCHASFVITGTGDDGQFNASLKGFLS